MTVLVGRGSQQTSVGHIKKFAYHLALKKNKEQQRGNRVECPYLYAYFLARVNEIAQRDLRCEISSKIQRLLRRQKKGNSIGLMISNLREDKDVIYSAIFIAFVAPLRVQELFFFEWVSGL